VGQRHKSFPLAALAVTIIDPVSESLLGEDGQTNKHPIVAETEFPSLNWSYISPSGAKSAS
jgi:hypothetical protein